MTVIGNHAAVEEIQWGVLPGWRISTKHGEATLIRSGAQLLQYRPHGQPSLIWLSEEATASPGRSVRGGIPICWPWFGDLARNPPALVNMVETDSQPPAHGLVRNRDWTLESIVEDQEAVTVRLSLLTVGGLPGWPHPARLSVSYRFGEQLDVALRTENLGTHTLVISQALHTYFAVGDSRRVRIEGLDGTRYVDTLDDWSEHEQQGDLSIDGEIDRIYFGMERPIILDDPVYQRRICVQARGSRSAVLWNPWIAKSQRLTQFAPDAWQRMFCIETARVLDDVMVIPPGGYDVMGVEIRIV